ncbi:MULTISPECIES: MFS transporter [Streptomycetaceae]|uniref:Integral membrane transport protein n=1 Tax=Streptantibioticus cattleyicolor (strain ATCC 35852 / DSM 46488 / JCM 4925 / NBRC 14057 / NRRL 8057) TaxID=1003195 RepID=F8JV78_STREN|nr:MULTISPECIES: MFS transporter [Streptomycetaceae]AEW93164.1 integral membrane transport protein [Streptantibioticus cattleyicolor NRRL 8057 = DSM 46488]MYS57890.1 MFS transporter [Streptomyces sp. SID5468]CCB73522.1 putative integral membrane transport protein [Streptantibioticus cattleyicolor NRRL 8057 = DSM 46488]
MTAFFALDGFTFAGWLVRIPAIKAHVGASPGALGMALLGVSAGAVATMVFTGRLCHRYGSHRVTVGCGVLLALSVALPPLTRSALALGLVLLVFGAAYGSLNVSMNSLAVDLVAAVRRPVMPGFHAAFSFGGLTGSALGGLLAPHLSPAHHLLLLTPVGLLVSATAGRTLLAHPVPRSAPEPAGGGPAPEDGPEAPPCPPGRASRSRRGHPPGGKPPRSDATGASAVDAATADGRGPAGPPVRVRWLVLVLGLIALCDAYGEGALADWSALHLSQDLHTGPGLAAAAYAPFALAMTVGRLSGTTLLERLGRTRTVVLGGLTGAAGMLVGALAPQPWLVLTGFAVTGLGLANIFPVAVGGAGALAGPGGVAVASTLGYGGMLLGPPSIGFLAEATGLPLALTTVALLAAVASGIALATRDSAGP